MYMKIQRFFTVIILSILVCLCCPLSLLGQPTYPTIYFNGLFSYDATTSQAVADTQVTSFNQVSGVSIGDALNLSGSYDNTAGYFSGGTITLTNSFETIFLSTGLNFAVFGDHSSTSISLAGIFDAEESWLGDQFSTSSTIDSHLLLNDGAQWDETLLNTDFTALINGNLKSSTVSSVPAPSSLSLIFIGVLILLIKKSLRRFSGTTTAIAAFLWIILPGTANAFTTGYLDIQTLSSDTGLTLSGDTISLDATAIAIGDPYVEIDPVDFTLKAYKNSDDDFYSGTFSSQDLLAGTFDNFALTEATTVLPWGTITRYSIHTDLLYTGGTGSLGLSEGKFSGSVDSLNEGQLISKIYDINSSAILPAPVPSALILLFSGLLGLSAIKRRRSFSHHEQ